MVMYKKTVVTPFEGATFSIGIVSSLVTKQFCDKSLEYVINVLSIL